MSNKKKITLEDTFSQLEEIIEKLEQPEIALEESFALYQSGMEKIKNCNTMLDEVEKKMQVLTLEGEIEDFE